MTLATHHYPVAANDEARAFFDQGLIFAYGFNHLEALRAFRHAQQLDPDCAMCFWGEAYVLGPNLNLPMEKKAAPIARAAAAKAAEKAAKTSPKEQALAAAILARYAETGERAALDRTYADAMLGVARAFPDDADIATLAAESLMLLSPWDYWSDAGRTRQRTHAGSAAAAGRGAREKPRAMSPRSTSISIWWKRPTSRNAPNPMPTGCAAPCPARATSCTCPRTFICALADTRTRSTSTRMQPRRTSATSPQIPACRVRIRRCIIRTMCIST